MKARWSRSLHLVVIAVGLGVALGVVRPGQAFAAEVQRAIVDRHAQRPPAHSFLGYPGVATTSAQWRSVTWPSSGTNWFEFDYFVDSEPNFDFFNVYVDGAVMFHQSGAMQGGRAHIAVTGGSHEIKFEYSKDLSVDFGTDTAWVDHLSYQSTAAGTVGIDEFDSRQFDPTPWSRGGYGGGWGPATPAPDGEIRRPGAHSHLGYQSAPTTSAIQRTVTFPASSTKNRCSFRYYVDSEQNFDFLNVYLDGAKSFSISGHAQTGRQILSVPTTGSHVIMFEYRKDTSVDYGYDIARVDQFVCQGSAGAFETAGFDGELPGSVPSGWSSSGFGGGWVASRPSPPRSYVSTQTVSAEPVVDGALDKAEYASTTEMDLTDYALPGGSPGNVRLEESDGSQALFLGLRVHSGTKEIGNEGGALTLLFDANHADTLSGLGCGPTSTTPRDEDRRIVISYSAAGGQGSPTVTVSQAKGSCDDANPWAALTASEEWPVSVAASEGARDPEFLELEVKVTLHPASAATSEPLASRKLGFALRHAGSVGLTGLERVPRLDGSPAVDGDVASYATLSFVSWRPDLSAPPPAPRAFSEPTEGRVEAIPDIYTKR